MKALFKIQNVACIDTEGFCCLFPYKGYVISLSTIFMPKDIAVLKNGEFINNRISSVEEAISIVDNLIKNSNNIKKDNNDY